MKMVYSKSTALDSFSICFKFKLYSYILFFHFQSSQADDFTFSIDGAFSRNIPSPLLLPEDC